LLTPRETFMYVNHYKKIGSYRDLLWPSRDKDFSTSLQPLFSFHGQIFRSFFISLIQFHLRHLYMRTIFPHGIHVSFSSRAFGDNEVRMAVRVCERASSYYILWWIDWPIPVYEREYLRDDSDFWYTILWRTCYGTSSLRRRRIRIFKQENYLTRSVSAWIFFSSRWIPWRTLGVFLLVCSHFLLSWFFFKR